jgi:hypothetical protein
MAPASLQQQGASTKRQQAAAGKDSSGNRMARWQCTNATTVQTAKIIGINGKLQTFEVPTPMPCFFDPLWHTSHAISQQFGRLRFARQIPY